MPEMPSSEADELTCLLVSILRLGRNMNADDCDDYHVMIRGDGTVDVDFQVNGKRYHYDETLVSGCRRSSDSGEPSGRSIAQAHGL